MNNFPKGVHVQILAGTGVPRPLSAINIALLRAVEVTQVAGAASGFQLIFDAARGAPPDPRDYSILQSSAVAPFSRVVISVLFNGIPEVLIDGFVTHQELLPVDETNDATVAIIGEDATVMMDLEEKTAKFPGQNDYIIVGQLLARYVKYGLKPSLKKPSTLEQPLPTQRVPIQHATDLGYIRYLAERYGFLFHVTPTRIPLLNDAYWGPPEWSSSPQPPLSVAMDELSNVESISFTYDMLAPTKVAGKIQNPATGKPQTISVSKSTLPPLSKKPALKGANVRTTLVRDVGGYTENLAKAQSQGVVDRSTERVVVAEGSLNVLDYGGALHAKRTVALRGAGATYDGLYYVERATHTLQRGSYDISFRLTRDGTGSTIGRVSP